MNIYESITSIMSEGYAITKDKKNQQQGFKYRGIDDVMNTFFPLLSKHKVFCVPEVINCTREERQTTKGGNLIYSILTTRYTFYAEDGSSVSAVVVGEGMDSGDKASNKALAVGMKYAMFQVFCIPTEEFVDPDETTPEPSVPKEHKTEHKIEHKTTSYVCSDCGNTIADYYNSTGKVALTARDIAARSMDAYGRQLCMECAKAARMAQAQEQVDANNGG
jgi:hypothetical protein